MNLVLRPLNGIALHRVTRCLRVPASLLACSLVLMSGCKGTSKAADNPVVGPRPPRISDRMLAQMTDAGGETPEAAAQPVIIRTSSETVATSGIEDTDVAARVNGTPIFVSEVLERYRPQLAAQREQVSPADYDRLRRQLLEQELPAHIEQALVLDAARAQFKQEQWETLQDKLDEFFYEEEVPSLQKRLKAANMQEVEAKLQMAGTTLSAYRRVWGDRQVAGQWISEKIPEVSVSRKELLEEYESKLESYREPEQVKWQECLILNSESGGPDGAKKRVQRAIADLKAGQSFTEVVATHSDGPDARSGGHWDWTQPSSLADERLVEVLKSLQIDQIGPVLENEQGYRLVKLTGYRPERVTPFEEVQKELREAVVQRKKEAAATEIIANLKKSAHIESILESSLPAG
jgi:hypothetical protein